MDERMFYCYLEYKKNNSKSVWKALKKFPIKVLVTFILLCVVSILAIIVVFIPIITYFAWLLAFAEIALCVLLSYFIEDFNIQNSKDSITEYRKHCREMIDWLREQGYTSYDSISLLYERLTNHINRIKTERDKKNEHVEKWIQVLAVPIVLAVFSSLIAKQGEISEIIKGIMPFGFICIIIYCVFWGLRNVYWLPEKRKLEQRKYFADELQDILDIYATEKEEKIVAKK